MDIAKTQSDPTAGPAGSAERLSGADRILLTLAAIGLAGTALMGNPAPPTREWPAGSLLQDIVWVLSLGYRLPTLRGIEVKTLLVSVVCGVLLVWASLRALGGRLRLLPDLPEVDNATSRRASAATLSLFAVLMLVGWALASSFWARDAATALGSTWVLSLGWIWAAGLALHGHRRLVRPLIDVLLTVAGVTAVLSLWYWHVRAIESRLGWPLGNPLSLASVMVPTVLIAAGRVAEKVGQLRGAKDRARTVGAIIFHVVILGLTLATLLATGSRGPLLALLVGGALAGWVAAPRERRVALGLAGVLLITLAAPGGIDWLFSAGRGRDASARMRVYAWRDALQMLLNKPAAGQGAGGYSLLATGMSAEDCVRDPLAMSGQVSSDAHCEPLELLADLGVFGGVVGLAAWGFAIAAGVGAARKDNRWLAAAIAGATTAALVDASTGVSWRLPGPAPFLAIPAALAWMLWREAPAPAPARRTCRYAWTGLIPAVVGLAAGAAGIADFAAARYLYHGQAAMQQVERAMVQRATTMPADASAAQRQEISALATYGVEQADLAARWQIDPPRRLVAWLARGQMRASLAYLPLLQQDPNANVARQQAILDDGLAILRGLATVAPGYADTDWRISELLNAKASLAGQGADAAALAQQARRQALTEALQYLGYVPLDRERVWQTMSIWPEIPPAQRLSLLRGTLREEGEVWRQDRPAAPAYVRWTQRASYLVRLWQHLGEGAASVGTTFMELGYSALPVPYAQWQDPLTPEGVRLAAVRLVLQGRPAEAADALELANLLYERAGGLLPYSQAATYLDLAACRIRQGRAQAGWASAALAEARRILQPLPDNTVRRQLAELADALQQGIDVVAATYAGTEPEAWWVAVDLFWDMPSEFWPAEIQSWAERTDAGLAARGTARSVALELLIAKGDAGAAQAKMQQMLAGGTPRTAIETGLREAGYRWPARQALVQALMRGLAPRPQ